MSDLARAWSIRLAQPEDADAIHQIDAECLETGHATFRDTPHDWPSFAAAFESGPALVLVEADVVQGWAAVARSSARAVYRGVGETSVYVSPQAHGRGVGTRLLQTLIERAEDAGFWTLTAQIFPENEASLALHQRQGFDILGRRRALGRMTYGPEQGKWRDVMFLERRSPYIGQD